MKTSTTLIPPQDVARQFCIEDFYASLRDAISNAGGSYNVICRDTDIGTVTLSQLADILAANGVRFVYDKIRTIDNVRGTLDFYVSSDDLRRR